MLKDLRRHIMMQQGGAVLPEPDYQTGGYLPETQFDLDSSFLPNNGRTISIYVRFVYQGNGVPARLLTNNGSNGWMFGYYGRGLTIKVNGINITEQGASRCCIKITDGHAYYSLDGVTWTATTRDFASIAYGYFRIHGKNVTTAMCDIRIWKDDLADMSSLFREP